MSANVLQTTAEAFIENYAAECGQQDFARAAPRLQQVLGPLLHLDALCRVQAQLAWYLEAGLVSAEQARQVWPTLSSVPTACMQQTSRAQRLPCVHILMFASGARHKRFQGPYSRPLCESLTLRSRTFAAAVMITDQAFVCRCAQQ